MWWRLILGVVLNLAASLFVKPPPGPAPANQDGLGIPRADEGARVFDFAGTQWQKSPHVAAFGDFGSESITKRGGPFKMKKATVGHRYYLGLHLILARQIDGLIAVKLATKTAWTGMLAAGRGGIHNMELFGGNEREGGFSSAFDLMDGNPSQPVNDYLASLLGPLTSAYRGVVSLVFRRAYIGANSARLPAMEFKLLNIAGIHRGWLPEKAIIGLEMGGGSSSIYIALDSSLTMTGARLATARAALAGLVRSLKGSINSIRIVAFSDVINGSIERFDCTDADYEDIALWLEAFNTTTFGGDWELGVASAPTFFQTDRSLFRGFGSVASAFASFLGGTGVVGGETRRKVVIFVGDNNDPNPGAPEEANSLLSTISGVEVYAFNIALGATTEAEKIDNTPGDGVPVVAIDDPGALSAAMARAFIVFADVNPAHIIRCLWTDPMRGGVADPSEIGESFAAAADLFLAEGFGLSVPFRGADLVEADRLEVERHVDAVSYRSRRTGKIEIKPIRNDFNPVDLPVLDSSIVLEWSGLERTNRGELPNQLTVIYTRRDNGEPASVTRTNTAGVRRAGRTIPGEPVQYPFITRPGIATRACLRDLAVQDRPLLAGTLRLAYLPTELEIGEPFIINEPLLGISNVVVRIMESQEGNGRDNSVTVKVSEHRYALPAEGIEGVIAPPPALPTRPEPSPFRVVQEAPYYLLINATSQAEVESALSAEPDAGFLLATGAKATAPHRDMTVAVDAGAGFTDEGLAEFAVSALTLTALMAEADDVVVTIPAAFDLSAIMANSLAMIGSEIVRIDGLADDAGNVAITIGRGCLDTVPAAHAIGTRIFFIDAVVPRETQYVAGASVSVKLLTNLDTGILTLPAAPIDVVTFSARAIRPYPPGQLKLNGTYAQDQITGNVVLTWVHRDRTLQATPIPEDHDAASIGPEAGTTYRVRAEALGLDDELLSVVTDVNVGSVLTYDWPDTTSLPVDTIRVRFSVASVRGGYESWQRPSITVATGLKIRSLDDLAGARSIEDGADTIRVTEDR